MIKVQLSDYMKVDFRSNESYKALRTNIQFCGDDVKVIAITSTVPNEGKSSVSIQLAASIAETGKKVLLIDADLRKSVLIGRYEIGKAIKGFSHFLSKQATFEEVLCDTDIKNMHLIFAGQVPPNPSELLGKEQFKKTIDVLRELYDYIIIDTPPIGAVIDAAVIAQKCDGIALVVATDKVGYKFIRKSVDQLQKSECPILGVILNKVDMKSRYYGGHYGNYYGNYGEY